VVAYHISAGFRELILLAATHFVNMMRIYDVVVCQQRDGTLRFRSTKLSRSCLRRGQACIATSPGLATRFKDTIARAASASCLSVKVSWKAEQRQMSALQFAERNDRLISVAQFSPITSRRNSACPLTLGNSARITNGA
jgi:hypothetical protein